MLLKTACIQMDIAFGQPEQNYKKVKDWFKKAADQGCQLAVLPELWTTGYDLTRLDEIADDNAEEAIQFLKEQAKLHNMHLVAGSVANRKEAGVENTLIVIDNKGNLVKTYSKLHLFRLMEEEKFLQAGAEDGLFTLEDETMAGFICYDIRFPEWMRKHVLNGAKVLFVPAEWPLARVDHWRTLLLARAIENQSYVVACNRSGSDPNNVFAGHSIIIDPWGEIIAEAGEGEELLIGDIDLSKVEEIRERIPVFEDRRIQFYEN
ncbi:putative amidohydrolase [Bacillus ectoiniformans]|uniref:carbon-nitrogen family hydrolase n=1 Tax=Bacillus ectoiniformans TaxID=1494429 RepID=UPI00195D2EEA|nr:carbon-nitrogen family hydrolase [Bacillus ectoiniformans]MBM7649578.1 putative amidohydrolase [Bacillus ectoiniformans]